MKRAFFGLLILVVFSACENTAHHATIDAASNARQELNSLKREKARMQREVDSLKSKTAGKEHAEQPQLPKEPVEETSPVPEKPLRETIEQPVIKINDKGAVHYFKGTRKVAVRITPWKDNRREVICYDVNGNVTYSFDDVRESYSQLTEVVSFHENGAAHRIHNSTNPGASLYFYETNYTFDEENYPVQKEEIEYPQTLDKMLDNVRHWDREKRAWV